MLSREAMAARIKAAMHASLMNNDVEAEMSALVDQLAAPPRSITYLHVMSALALVPTEHSHPDKCRWIAKRLNNEP